MHDLHDDKPYWGAGEVLKIALPTAAGMVNATVQQFIDSLLIANLVGTVALSAQFVAGILAFLPLAMAQGVVSVVNTFVAQNLGAKHLDQCGRYTWAGLYLAGALGLLAVPLALLAGPIMTGLAHFMTSLKGAATSEHELGLQIMYFRYMAIAGGIGVAARVVEQFFYGTHRPMVVFVSSLIAVSVNLVVAYSLMVGLGGLPKLGLRGAAIGTLVGTILGFLVPFAIFLGGRSHREYRTRTSWPFRAKALWDILRVGWPAGVQFFIDIAAWSLFIAVLVGYFGDVHKAASAAVMRYLQVSFMPAVGIGIACTALVGRYIGMGRPDLARRRAHAAIAIGVAYMGVCGALFFVLRYPFLRLFVAMPGEGGGMSPAQVEQAVTLGATLMICAAIFQVFDAVGIVYTGALRGAGDTLYPMVLSAILGWTLIVGAGCAAIRYFPGLGSIGPWITSSLYVIVLGIVMAVRFERGRWTKLNLLGGPVPQPAVTGPGMPEALPESPPRVESETP